MMEKDRAIEKAKKLSAQRVRLLRLEQGWSQTEMAHQIHLTLNLGTTDSTYYGTSEDANGRARVCQVERGKNALSIENALAYAQIFSLSLDYLYGLSDERQPGDKNIQERTGITENTLQSLVRLTNFRKSRSHLGSDIVGSFFNLVVGNSEFWIAASEMLVYIRRLVEKQLVLATEGILASDGQQLEVEISVEVYKKKILDLFEKILGEYLHEYQQTIYDVQKAKHYRQHRFFDQPFPQFEDIWPISYRQE